MPPADDPRHRGSTLKMKAVRSKADAVEPGPLGGRDERAQHTKATIKTKCRKKGPWKWKKEL